MKPAPRYQSLISRSSRFVPALLSIGRNGIQPTFSRSRQQLTPNSVKMLAQNIPEAAIKALFDQFQPWLAEPENCTKVSLDLNLSILNPHTTEWQPSPGSSSSASLLGEIFELQAKKTPECTAIDFLEPESPRELSNRLQILSYEDVNNKMSDALSKGFYYVPPHWGRL